MASSGTSPIINPSEGSGQKDHTSALSSESEFDDSLAVPPSLSVINVAPQDTLSEVDAGPKVQFQNEIPYKTIFNEPVKFNSVRRKAFIPGIEIQVKFVKHERNISSNILNPNLYIIHLSHGDFSWTISKRYKHILHLHQQLVLYRATLNIPFPSKTHREHRNSVRLNIEESNKTENGSATPGSRRKSKLRSPALPRFPKKPELLVSFDDIENRMKQLEAYLHSLCNITIYRNHHELVTFLEVSNISFICDLGFKGKECMVKKKAGSTLPGQTGCDCCGLLHYGVCNRCSFFCSSLGFGRWRERWFFVKDTFFGYMSPNDGKIKSIMLFDLGFDVSSGMYSTGVSNGLQILNLNRQMILRLWTKRKSKDWIEHLKHIANTEARDFTNQNNPHHAFVPMRSSIKASSFIDGGGYLSTIGDALEGAKEEIYITDWWLSPEIYLKRPITGEYWRLDQVLKRKASQGVKVFILLYKEVEMALGICSYYSKSQLFHENIKVLRHPDHAKAGVFLWAHHEKIVCIDQSIAFVGGIDLCYGRWDDHKHRLSDLGSIVRDNSSRPKSKKMTSSRPRFLKDSFEKCDDNISEVEEEIEKSTADEVSALPQNLPTLQPGDHLLMPKNAKPNTPPIVFLEDHYNPVLNSRRNIMDTITDKSKDILNFFGNESPLTAAETSDNKEREKAANYARNMNMFFPENELQQEEPIAEARLAIMPTISENESGLSINDMSLVSGNENNKSKLWIGKDYANFIVKDFTNLDSPFVDLVDRTTTPRMPWHDIATMVEGAAARDVARHFIQRWNAHKFEKFKNNATYPYLMPKSYTDIKVPNIIPNLEKHNVTCQILRSLTCWSGGFVEADSTEQSIHEAYLLSINKAQHYIYIENQFFITLSINSSIVRNRIGEEIFNRIMQAHKAKSKFRVFVVMPLLPAFEGEVGASSGTSLHAITHWNYQSISCGKESLIVRLKEAGIKDPSEYITFHGLRNHSVLEGEPVSELIYVHSKLMIVDDRVVICGSANINDRSLLGARDSEVAAIFQDETFDDGYMNGEVFPSGRFAGSLRKRLFREHLGMIGNSDRQEEIDLKDPVIDSFYKDKWLAISRSNTEIYEKVFSCIPTNSVRSFADLKKYNEDNQKTMWETDPVAANNEIDKIVGHLVDFPLEFLADEVLTPSSKSVMGIMPTSLWT